ncbi:MAG: TRAP transporter small permease [Thalassotalea sp.]
MTDYKKSNNSAVASEHTLDFDIEEDESFNYSDYKIEDWLAFVLFWFLAFTVFAQFISRYVFEAPLGWTEEVARYQLVCLGFLGGCAGVRKNSHIFVSLFHRWMPANVSKILYKIIAITNTLFLMTLAYFAWQIIPLIHIHTMASLAIPISVLYGIILGSLVIMIIRSGQYLQQVLTNKTNIDTPEVEI